MKLTSREIELVSKILKNRRYRKLSAWLGLAAALAAFIGALYFDLNLDSLGPVIGVFLGISGAELASVYFRVRPEDKLIDLLQRYINNDPEAVRQFSFKALSGENAPSKALQMDKGNLSCLLHPQKPRQLGLCR